MKQLSKLILNSMETDLKPNRVQLLKMHYGAEVLRNEGIKIILLTVIFSLLGQAEVFLFCISLLIPVRIFSGGLHMKTNVSCFLFSFCFFSSAILLLPRIPISETGYRIVLGFAVMLVCLFSPIAASRKPIVSRQKFLRCKYSAVISSIAAGVLLYNISYSLFQHSGIWTLALQALQLSAAYLHSKFKERKNENEKIQT